MTIGVRELRNNLRAVLSRVKQGEEVVVSERGRPIARITSPDRSREELIAAGILTPARRPKRPASQFPSIPIRGGIDDLLRDWR